MELQAPVLDVEDERAEELRNHQATICVEDSVCVEEGVSEQLYAHHLCEDLTHNLCLYEEVQHMNRRLRR